MRTPDSEEHIVGGDERLWNVDVDEDVHMSVPWPHVSGNSSNVKPEWPSLAFLCTRVPRLADYGCRLHSHITSHILHLTQSSF